MKKPLPFLDKTSPEAWSTFGEVRRAVAVESEATGVQDATRELMNLRISQLNGCAFCVHLHHCRAVRAGVPDEQLAQFPVWRDSPWFDAVERAALLLGETGTTLPEQMVRDRDLFTARDVPGDGAFAALDSSAVLMNAYNRLSMLSHHPVPGAR